MGMGKDMDSANLYLENMNGRTSLHCASSNGHESEVSALLAAGADHGATDQVGWTPLYCASCKGHASVVSALLAAGADHTMA